MKTKICFKCNLEKILTDFYPHKQMGDGYLNKCKECNKKDTKERSERKLLEPEFVVSERKRGRRKYHRLYAFTGKADAEANKKWMSKFPEKRLAALAAQHIPKPFDNAEKHHWSYNEEHYKDVIWLTKRHHMKAHRFVVYDQSVKKYRKFDNNELLDSKDVHEKWILFCIQTQED